MAMLEARSLPDQLEREAQTLPEPGEARPLQLGRCRANLWPGVRRSWGSTGPRVGYPSCALWSDWLGRSALLPALTPSPARLACKEAAALWALRGLGGPGVSLATPQSHCVPQPGEGWGDLRATKTQSCCAAPSWRIFYLVHCLLGSNTASRTTLSPRGWSRSSLLSSHGMTTSHSRHWIVWLSFAGQPCAVHCVQQSPQPSRVL